MPEIPKSFFHDPSEEVRGVLGQGYIASIISSSSVDTSVLVLTNKRLYQKGKIFEKLPSGKWVSVKGFKTVPVESITGSSFTEINPFAMFVAGWIFIAIFVIPLLIALFSSGFQGPTGAGASRGGGSGLLSLIFLIFGICLLVAYYLKRARIFVVENAGGQIGTNCKWYSESEILNFQKIISQEQDRIKINK